MQNGLGLKSIWIKKSLIVLYSSWILNSSNNTAPNFQDRYCYFKHSAAKSPAEKSNTDLTQILSLFQVTAGKLHSLILKTYRTIQFIHCNVRGVSVSVDFFKKLR